MINFKKIVTYRFGNGLKKGFTMLEVIFAIFVILVGVLGSYTVIQKTISYTYQSSLRLTAAYLAQEGIEVVRNIRDANWVQGEAWDIDLKIGRASCRERV